MLIRLLYASRATQEIDNQLLDSIFLQSRTYNPPKGITGILCFSGNIFMQVLEGSRREVSQLYSQIVSDSRHSNIEILYFEEITERRFSNWTMGQVNISKVNISTLLKYSEKPELDPFSVGGKMSLALLDDLIATAAITGRS